MSTLTFGFIGLGLIGGSIARAIRQNLPQSQIIAYDINADTLREAAQSALICSTFSFNSFKSAILLLISV